MALTLQMLKRAASEAIDKHAKDLHELSNDIWSHPELNFEEHFSHKALTDFLENTACFPDVERSYIVETGFRAVYGDSAGNKPHVGVLCEYDALPEIGHACGHNLIAEVGVAAGIGIKVAMDEAKKYGKELGQLTVLGTPAEEGGGGKVDMINGGAFKSMEVAMMSHPAPFSTAAPPALTAIQIVNIKYIGRASHAAAFPWEGINALDAAVMAYSSISAMRQQMKPSWRIHGIIVNGGAKPNIIPEEATMEYYIRAPTRSELQILKAKAQECFEAAGTATGCKVEISWHPKPYDNVLNNPTIVGLYEANAKEFNVEFEKDASKLASAAGSTDMGNVSFEVPSIHPFFHIGSKEANHTRGFTDAAGDPKAQPYTLTEGKLLAMTAIDIFWKPDLLSQINAEHSKQITE